MKYLAGLFAILTVCFWSPVLLAIIDLYYWYWFSYNLSGLAYDSSGRPLLLGLFAMLGFGTAVATITMGSLMEAE